MKFDFLYMLPNVSPGGVSLEAVSSQRGSSNHGQRICAAEARSVTRVKAALDCTKPSVVCVYKCSTLRWCLLVYFNKSKNWCSTLYKIFFGRLFSI